MKSKRIAILLSEEEILLLLSFFATDLSFMPLDESSFAKDIIRIINRLAQTVGVELKFENGRIIEAKKDGRVFFRAI